MEVNIEKYQPRVVGRIDERVDVLYRWRCRKLNQHFGACKSRTTIISILCFYFIWWNMQKSATAAAVTDECTTQFYIIPLANSRTMPNAWMTESMRYLIVDTTSHDRIVCVCVRKCISAYESVRSADGADHKFVIVICMENICYKYHFFFY